MTRPRFLFLCLVFLLVACQSNNEPPDSPPAATNPPGSTATVAPEPTIPASPTAPAPSPVPTEAELATATIPAPIVPPATDEFNITFNNGAIDSVDWFSETAVVLHQDIGGRYINAGAVIYHDGQYHMLNNEFSSWPATTRSYYYTSPDGETWTLMADEPVFESEQVSYTRVAALILTGYVEDDGTWVVYFHTFESNSSQGFIGRATAQDPLGPWVVDEEPVLSPGRETEWDNRHVMRPNVSKTDDGYIMIYAGTTGSTESQIGYATSPDGIVWTKYNDPATTDAPYADSDPIMQPQAEWEGTWLGRPEVIQTEMGWVMLYEGGGNSQTGIAISEDGRNWLRYEQNPILTTDNSVNNDTFFQGELAYHDGLFRYYLEVGPGARDTDVYLWTFPHPFGSNPAGSEPSSVRFMAFHGGRPDRDWQEANAEAYAAETGVEIEFSANDYYARYVNRDIGTTIAGSNPPDVMSGLIVGVLREYVAQGLIMDISDLWEEQGWDEVFPASLKEMVTFDDKQYFVPTAIQWNGVFYRQDVFDEVGLTPPETWDEMLAMCDTLNEAGYTPFAQTASSTWPPPIAFWFTAINLRLNGPEFHEQLMLGQERYDSPEVREVFAYYQEMFDRDCFASDATSTSYGGAVSDFDSGNFAMYGHGEWLYEFIGENTKANTGFFAYPTINPEVGQGELVPMWGAFIHADTVNPAGARDFLIYLASQASQQSNWDTLGRTASNLLVDPAQYDLVHAQGLELIENADYITQLYGANTHPDVAQAGYDAMVEFWRSPEDIDALLAEWEAVRVEVYGELAE